MGPTGFVNSGMLGLCGDEGVRGSRVTVAGHSNLDWSVMFNGNACDEGRQGGV